ncbi:MAG: single-stranded DNA-binding protein [Bacteroidia bacterium]|jgi:single-strand DNA-binding protein
MSVNKVILLGNLGRDPETRYLENNRVVTTFSLATSESFTDRNGERKTDTEWHRIEMWDNLAKIAEKYLRKGSQVYIEGKIKTDSWRDKEGNERTGTKIKALSMTLVGQRNADPPAGNPDTGNTANNTAPAETPAGDDDLPF